MDGTVYNDWRFVSLSPFPAWALVAIAIAVAAGVWLSTLALRREGRPGRRWLLLALRATAALALLTLLLEPGRRLMQTTRVKNRVAILLDRSGSMGFPVAPGGEPRLQAARKLLAASSAELAELSSRFSLETYAFDKDLQGLDPQRLAELSATGGATDLASAVHAAANGGGTAGRKLSGIVVLSDGADNAELAGGMTPKAKAMLEDLGVPVSTLAIGTGGLKDLAVEKVKVDDFAFVRNTLEVGATLVAHGFGSVDVPVVLKREGKPVATRTARLAGDGSAQVAFSFAPDQTGQFVYTVEAPVFEGEAVASNNARSFVLKVIRDRVRVLMVVGHPSWDVRFLRNLLRQDPNVDLVSFYILRTDHDDARIVSQDELSLIPFPVQEIFHDQLHTFDLVVLQNFAWNDGAYRDMPMYIAGMRDYVLGGGALVMVGGENSFGEGGYERTELQEVLPVEPSGTPPSVDALQARLTAEGKRHPVTAVATSAESSEKAWADLPPIDGVNVTRARPGARVLLDHPFMAQDGKNVPVLALGEFGRGRSLALCTDASWMWAFGAAGAGNNARVYDRFWNNAIRWLVRDPDLTQVKVAVEKPGVEPGEPVAAVVTARTPDWGPAAGAEVELELVHADANRLEARLKAVAGPDGTARIEVTPPRAGPYKLVARAAKDGTALGQGEDAVAVRAAGPELSDAAPKPELLKAIADATGGLFAESPRSLPKLPLVDPETVEVGRRKDEPIWDRAEILAVLALAIAAEWFLRRRWGYV